MKGCSLKDEYPYAYAATEKLIVRACLFKRRQSYIICNLAPAYVCSADYKPPCDERPEVP